MFVFTLSPRLPHQFLKVFNIEVQRRRRKKLNPVPRPGDWVHALPGHWKSDARWACVHYFVTCDITSNIHLLILRAGCQSSPACSPFFTPSRSIFSILASDHYSSEGNRSKPSHALPHPISLKPTSKPLQHSFPSTFANPSQNT